MRGHAAEFADRRVATERPNGVTRGPCAHSQPDPSQRAKVLRLELSRAVRVARESAGLTQEQLAAAAGVNRGVVRRWEDGSESMAPTLRHLAIAPRDLSLPLLAWAARQHDHELVALPDGEIDAEHAAAEAMRACVNLQRALLGGGDAYQRDAYRRMLAACRVGLAAGRRTA